jgi:hypothetical protein
MSSKQVGGNRYQNVVILFAPEVLADKVIEVAVSRTIVVGRASELIDRAEEGSEAIR